MNDDERRLARALGRCTYLPGSADKRFARWLSQAADDTDAVLSDKTREYLKRMAKRYRRQLGSEWERWCLVQGESA